MLSTASTFWTHFALKRGLWWQFTVRAVEMRHRGSYLGFLWSVLNPLLMAAFYVGVFGFIFHRRFRVLPDETGVDYAVGVFLSLVLFHLVSETMAAAPASVSGQPNLVKKVVFPLEVLPLAQLGAFWFHALISLVLCLATAALFGHGFSFTGLLWLPVILGPLLLLTAGLSWFLAALGVFFRDISQVLPVLAQILLFSSAVFYAPADIPPSGWVFLKWNPLLHSIDLARHTLLWHQPPSLLPLVYTWATGAVVLCLGFALFHATKRSFAEVL